mmetsp:Transcript_8295/g.16353  ORF Transcript_8295/g.16353 Transcript_8295/m.16353 type:complete len:157 (+) Transcript_8295:876-1346(+)|eukprot:CAMPEP_0204905058 /NCGR_PEP_ID=MMETSP1397-20131031/5217_1 /ASSEMBLY_ACC=CAM_ASM_000891 /TAXON_ID=49980 /ORGANISM="Climacostomum Climacostomum virens, Strain Stock W-24" /LENGTH=156 /DNA_ID=CAMNT_0052073911 /DNA_START=230 /DNA_END=700 /DNA_ORIENTATION=-
MADPIVFFLGRIEAKGGGHMFISSMGNALQKYKMSDKSQNSDPRPVVDLSSLSIGSLRRYQALYGIDVDPDRLLDGVRSHFGCVVYSKMKPSVELKSNSKRFKPHVEITVREEPSTIETREATEAIEHFLKVKKDDKEESGLRKSTRKREKVEKKF